VRGRGVRLRARDLEILLALAKMRLLKTSDIARLFFGAVGTTQKRLRKLYDAGLVKAAAPDLAAENRYALTRLGDALLRETLGDAAVPVYRCAPRVDGRALRHLDMLNGYRIALALGAARVAVTLHRFTPEWDLRSENPTADLVPDAVFVLHGPQTQAGFALEVDAATEPPMTVAKKLDAYESKALGGAAVFGVAAPIVLLVVPTSRRAVSLSRALGAERRATDVLVGITDHLLPDGGLRAGFCRPQDIVLAADGGSELHSRGLLDCLRPPPTRARVERAM
jgi:hypothetical protein